MKYLLLSLVLSVASLAYSEDKQEINELSDNEIKSKLVSLVQDVKNQNMLENTAEFKECKDLYKFEPGKTPGDPEIKKITDCFDKKMPKDKEKLEKLSNALGLQAYKLTPSNNVKDVSSYLGDKLYESLTGVSKKDKNNEQLIKDMKFGTKKLIDQRIFIDLYKTQLAKNSLLEVSRFCLQDLRRNVSGVSMEDFNSHWSGYNFQSGETLTDDGSTRPFIKSNNLVGPNVTDKKIIRNNVLQSISSGQEIDTTFLESFFLHCGQKIFPLCKSFKESTTANLKDYSTGTGSPSGSKACLAQTRLQEMRKAFSNADKIAKQFDEMSKGGREIPSEKIANFFNPNGNPETSLDSLTNFTSEDLLEGGNKKDSKLEACEKEPTGKDCEGYAAVGDDLEKAKQNIDYEFRLKKEVELERVKLLVQGDRASLKEYLQTNGYLDIVDDADKIDEPTLAAYITKNFDAQRIALVTSLQQRVGSRQITDKEAEVKGAKETAVESGMKASREERARLAQVVLFNNIITSQLTLKTTDGKVVGRNTGAINKELASLGKTDAKTEYFKNLKVEGQTDGGGRAIADVSFLDAFIGKPAPNAPNNP